MLQVNHLCKSYGNIHSVKDISFTIGDHETVGLLGPNGAGKSTTMRMLAGYLAPTSGDITLMGQSMTANPREAKRHIGYLPELPPLYLDMTVAEQLRFVCSLRDIPKAQVKRECARVCEMLNISHVAGRAIGHLSKGYRQRVGFAAALVGEPKLLILDEPTVGLDPQQIIDIRKLILELSVSMSVIISSHVLSEIASVCSRILILDHGELAADGTPNEIEADYRHSSILSVSVRGDRALAADVMKNCVKGRAKLVVEERLQPDETDFVVTSSRDTPMEATVFTALASQSPNLILTAMQTHTPSLEDIFIDITKNGKRLVKNSSGTEQGA